MIYGLPTEKPAKQKQEIKEVIPEELTRILSERANQLDRHMENLKRETQVCNRLSNELSEGVNESNRSKRLHDKAMKEMEDEIGKLNTLLVQPIFTLESHISHNS